MLEPKSWTITEKDNRECNLMFIQMEKFLKKFLLEGGGHIIRTCICAPIPLGLQIVTESLLCGFLVQG